MAQAYAHSESPDERTMRYSDANATPGQRQYAMWNHLGPLIAYAVALGTSYSTFFIPAIVALALWMARRDEAQFLDDHGREALNFHISLVLLGVASVIVGVLLCGVGVVVTVPAVILLGIIGGITGAVAAHRGEYFRYPACIRFL